MPDEYRVKSTSASSAQVGDKILSSNSKFRKIIRPLIVDNPHKVDEGIKVMLLQQRAVNQNNFEDIPRESLASMKAREVVSFTLDSAETKRLYEELKNLYMIHSKAGVPRGDRQLVVGDATEVVFADASRVEMVRELISRGYSADVWNQLIESNPDLATRLSFARLHQTRVDELKRFEQMLAGDHKEQEWQNFFGKNTWIFGYGLDYRVLGLTTTQPTYSGAAVDGKGANQGDFLLHSRGNAKFTVLVEIKRPDTELLEPKPYRNDCYASSSELAGGVSQLRSNARHWETEGMRSTKNLELTQKDGVFTVRPKMILVIGNTAEIKDDFGKRESFELFRRGQNDVEILTFDEVYERAMFIVGKTEPISGERESNDFPHKPTKLIRKLADQVHSQRAVGPEGYSP